MTNIIYYTIIQKHYYQKNIPFTTIEISSIVQISRNDYKLGIAKDV
jgi:hypothetical protein